MVTGTDQKPKDRIQAEANIVTKTKPEVELTMASMSILYTEPKQSTYRGVEICYRRFYKGRLRGKEIRRTFFTNDPVKDYQAAVGYGRSKNPNSFICSSSVDNFVMDGNKYRFDAHDFLVLAKWV